MDICGPLYNSVAWTGSLVPHIQVARLPAHETGSESWVYLTTTSPSSNLAVLKGGLEPQDGLSGCRRPGQRIAL
jgi:hypothetical protein